MTGLLLVVAALAQGAAQAGDDTAQLERIRTAMDHKSAITTDAGTDAAGRPVFRMSVLAPKPEKPLWDRWTNVPSYIRPNMNGYRYDYLQMVTPEAFRGGTFYSAGIPIGALLEKLEKRLDAAHRKALEQRARDEVQQALAELFACRADPSKPGC